MTIDVGIHSSQQTFAFHIAVNAGEMMDDGYVFEGPEVLRGLSKDRTSVSASQAWYF